MSKVKTFVSISILNVFLILSLVGVVSSAKGVEASSDAETNKDLYSVQNINVTLAPDSTNAPTPIDTAIPENTLIPTTKPTNKPTPKPTSKPVVAPTKAPSNRCIIVIQGVKYDVTDFRKIHSGGNIFQCGTDMTSVFFSQHNSSYLSLMAKYKV